MKLFNKDLKNFGEPKGFAKYVGCVGIPFVAYLAIVITVNSFFYGRL